MPKLEQRFHQLRKIVLALSGANEEVLALVPSERARFESLGWAILITSGVAAVSMWFALASAVGINGILAFPIALAWGLVIMGIDRWLVVTMPVEGRRKFAIAVPRLALALLLGTLISTPLVLRIFQSEINAQIAKMQQQSYNTFLQQQQASDVAKQVGTYSSELQYLNNVIATHGATTANTASDPELRGYNKQLTTLNTELTHWTSLKNQYYNDYICQLYGGPTCPKKGYGPAAKDSQQNYDAASAEVGTLQGQINQVQGEIQQRDAQLTSTSKAGRAGQVPAGARPAADREERVRHGAATAERAAGQLLREQPGLARHPDQAGGAQPAQQRELHRHRGQVPALPALPRHRVPAGHGEAVAASRASTRRRSSRRGKASTGTPASSSVSGRGSSGRPGRPCCGPCCRLEPDPRLDAIWTPRALPGSVGSEDDQPAEADDGTWSSWELGRADYGPDGGQAGSDHPERPWSGAKRWLNHWQGRLAEDDEPAAKETRHDVHVADPTAGSAADSGVAETRRDHGPADEPRRADGYWPDRGQESEYGSDGFRVPMYRGQDPSGRHSRDQNWYDEETSGEPSDQGSAPAAPPGNGGTPLTWEDE